jgi:hypothetical protein
MYKRMFGCRVRNRLSLAATRNAQTENATAARLPSQRFKLDQTVSKNE